MLAKQFIKATVGNALEEDLKYGDVTTEAIVSPQAKGGAAFMPRRTE